MAKKKQIELTIEEKLQNALVPKEEQPYKIPNNWCWVRLDFLLKEICNGTTIKQNKEGKTARVTRIESLQNNTIDFNRIGNIVNESLIKDKDWYIEGDIIVSHINSIEHVGKSAVITRDMLPLVHGMNLLRLRLNNICNSQFFQLYTRTTDYKKSIVNRVNRAVNQVSINQKQLCSLEIPITNLKEQQRIVNRIESLFVKLDRAKELIENTLAQFEQNKMAILHKAFTGELTVKWIKKNNIDLSSWKKYELKEVFKVVKDKYNPQIENQIVNYIGLENIETSKGIINKNNSSEVKSIKTKFKKDDVLYGKLRPYLNKHDVVNFDGICSTDILVFRFDNINTAKYINYYFNLPMFIQYAVENSSGINLPRVSEKTISKYKISLPIIEEQQEIVNILDKLLAKYNKIKNLEQQLEKIELLKKAILAKAFRGELGTNNPDEESAENLLKEILAEK
ncbi:restriction endonuclease subunit S [Megamonas funiformis]|uniref:restriction endonuclease subunit S n=1 Tax=Megamonas funiformis TaxID=437897 RepID=UPI0024AE2A22|nr:restriction endonuclease subunit S [Megamonas funiformis]